ncbi:MAG: hypothetical protein OEM23_05280 [Gemmatimonadota bacterium]|nr:hypothetical protein [Gemmatimonadota bacterium]MDH3427828.1 hypothetical protein [Gemmatimonadota bacterium]
MKPRLMQAIIGGLAGTIVMTLMMYFVAPMMMGGPMDVAAMLGDMMGMSNTVGMIVHFLLGALAFPALFALVLWDKLPGDSWMKGLVFGMALFLIAQAVVMPMAGAGVFSANHPEQMMAVLGSLVGHALYGLILGWWLGKGVAAGAA